MRTPRNLSKPGACTCDECGNVRPVLWLARYRYWYCPLCWEHIEWVSVNRRKLIDAYKEEHSGEQSSIHPWFARMVRRCRTQADTGNYKRQNIKTENNTGAASQEPESEKNMSNVNTENCALGAVAKLQLTDTLIPFLDVNIGNPFFAHNTVWIRTSYEAAARLGGSGEHTSVCNFTIDECDKLVRGILVVYP